MINFGSIAKGVPISVIAFEVKLVSIWENKRFFNINVLTFRPNLYILYYLFVSSFSSKLCGIIGVVYGIP
jgi:hypothetical protein